MLDGFEDDLEMEEAAMNKSASVPIKAAKKSVSRQVTASELAEFEVKKLSDEDLDDKLKEFKGKKDKKEEENLFDTGKLLEDGDKEIVNVDSSTISTLVQMSGGMMTFAVIIFVSSATEYFEI